MRGRQMATSGRRTGGRWIDGTHRRFGDEGASTVEFALISPLLILLVFGIVEFGWLFAQHLDVRHGAREASRLVAVNWSATDPPSTEEAQRTEIIDETCNRMQYAGDAVVTMTLVGTDVDAAQKGHIARVSVVADPVQITGLFSPVLDPIELESEIDLRLEKQATWTQGSGTCP